MHGLGRLSGVVQPLFSVRSRSDIGIGDFGSLSGLLDWLHRAEQRLLMLLPLTPTSGGDTSPYGSRCSLGLSLLYIHLDWLPEGVAFDDATMQAVSAARESPTVQYEAVYRVKRAALETAFARFEAQGSKARAQAFASWEADNAHWIDAYSTYAALSEAYRGAPWWEWSAPLAARKPEAVALARTRHAGPIRFHAWIQWVAEEQWKRVQEQAREAGILLCGDDPFAVSADSADAWWWPQFVRRDARLGVPPDEFSSEGQDWGLPWIDFQALEADGDSWLTSRVAKMASYFHVRRIDHAVGYFRQYLRDEKNPQGTFLPADEPSQQTRGERSFKLLAHNAPLVAEDLGVIPRFVRDTLARLGQAGYQVMRWSREDGVYRDPHHYPKTSLVTTGTHDTEPLKTWWLQAESWEREAVCRTWPEMEKLSPPKAEWNSEVHEALLRSALNASSDWCVFPWQDLLGIEQRVNLPGTVGPMNWTCRADVESESLLTSRKYRELADWLAKLTREGKRAR